MKKIIKSITYTLIVFTLSACVKEVVQPSQMIKGEFALDDGSGLSNEYLSFKEGIFTTYRSSDKAIFMDGCYWHANFTEVSKEVYSIKNDRLFVDGRDYGVVELNEGVLELAKNKYTELKEFKDEYYSKIICEKSIVLPYVATTATLPVSIIRPHPSTTLNASSSDFEVSIEDNKLIIKSNDTKVDKKGTILLSYKAAESVSVTVEQKTSTFIQVDPITYSHNYPSGTYSFSYAVSNPAEGATLKAESNQNWLSDVVVSANSVSYKISENAASTNRTAQILLSCRGAADIIVTVTQLGAVTSISTNPSSQSVNYAGGNYEFAYSINNPRSGTSVVASTTDTWITDVKLVGEKVTYKVSENNSGSSRSGKITLKYGSYASKDFTVSQQGRSYDYIENGVNLGVGIAVLGDWNEDGTQTTLYWAPVNCGYEEKGTVNTDSDHRLGKLYQWGAGDSSLPYKYNGSPVVAREMYYDTVTPSPWYDPNTIVGTTSDKWNNNQGPCPEGWRLPTSLEFKVLCAGKNDDYGWVDKGTYAGQSNTYAGAEFFGANSDKTAGKGVFFPAAGFRRYYNGSAGGRGSNGYYWSSTPYPDYSNNAYDLYFYSSYLGPQSNYYRANAFSVRCVLE